MASYSARGLTLRYEQAGDGRPVILLHGMSNHCLAWAPQLVALLDVLEVAAAPVCGLSLGGMVAQQLLVDHPSG